jgi:hypothetical protein
MDGLLLTCASLHKTAMQFYELTFLLSISRDKGFPIGKTDFVQGTFT